MRLFTAPSIALGLGASLRIADRLSWDVLLRVGITATVVLWLAAVAVTLWCVFAPGGDRGPRAQPRRSAQRRDIAAEPVEAAQH